MIRFEDILDKVESYKPDFDEELLQKAYIFSAREHRGQVRDSGEPYLVHPLNVAHILADLHLDETPIAVRLGMGRLKNELEDLSFRYLHRREFEDLHNSVNEKLSVSGDLVDRVK